MKRWRWRIVVLALAILIVPVLVKQVLPAESRQLERVSLAESQYLEIAFQNRFQNLALGGLLFVPEGDGPFPAAVVIHGSGTSRRDNGWYLTLVKHLLDRGIVVLLPDKRGSEQSEGNWRTSGFRGSGHRYARRDRVFAGATIGPDIRNWRHWHEPGWLDRPTRRITGK